MEMRLKIGDREEALGFRDGFRFETTAEGLGVSEADARFRGPLVVEGTLENTGGAFRVSGEVRAMRAFVCDRCLAAQEGVNCNACLWHCPAEAIKLVPMDEANPKSAKVPVVDAEKCLGCGACEHLCPARPMPAMTVEGLETHRVDA